MCLRRTHGMGDTVGRWLAGNLRCDRYPKRWKIESVNGIKKNEAQQTLLLAWACRIATRLVAAGSIKLASLASVGAKLHRGPLMRDESEKHGTM